MQKPPDLSAERQTRFSVVDKAKKPKRQHLRQSIGEQLRYLRRNLRMIADMAQAGLLVALPPQRLTTAARHSKTVLATVLDV